MGASIKSNQCGVIVVIAEKVFHDLYLSLPLKAGVVKLCVPRNAHNEIKQHQPDVIVIDCGIDVEKGLRMLKETKEFWPHTPVIFLTDTKSYDAVVKAYRAGARDFIGKPVNLFDLRNTIENILKIKRSREARTPLAMSSSSVQEFTQGETIEKPAPVLRAIRHIEENLSDDITLDALAKAANLSKYHFSRLFYRHTKMTPMQFANHMRIEMARELLKITEMNVSIVAFQVGFNNLGSFIRQFKNLTGVTPSIYRKSLKKPKAV